jgi:hypothetical protein
MINETGIVDGMKILLITTLKNSLMAVIRFLIPEDMAPKQRVPRIRSLRRKIIGQQRKFLGEDFNCVCVTKYRYSFRMNGSKQLIRSIICVINHLRTTSTTSTYKENSVS